MKRTGCFATPEVTKRRFDYDENFFDERDMRLFMGRVMERLAERGWKHKAIASLFDAAPYMVDRMVMLARRWREGRFNGDHGEKFPV